MLIANLSDLTFDEARIFFEKNSSNLGTSFIYNDYDLSKLYNKIMCINLGKNKLYTSYADALKTNIVSTQYTNSITKK
jgi:hypothetical protein